MTLFPFILCCAAFLTATINALTMRVVRAAGSRDITESIAILIPMRNEERNVTECVESALASTQLSNFSVTVLNDNSTDQTERLLTDFGPRIKVLQGAALPAEWMGKNFALSQLSERSGAEFLVFSDADVRLTPKAISSSVALMQRLNWDYISPYPRQVARSFAELLIQPLLQWSWMSSVILRIAEKSQRPSTTIANGQLFIVRRSAYEEIGGHENIKNEVLDDMELARELVRHGFRGGVADASQVVSCRMYESGKELIEGYTKSLWRAFGGVSGTVLAILILTWTSLTPFYGALTGSLLACGGLVLTTLSRVVVAIRTRSNVWLSLLHPLAILFLLLLIALSWMKKRNGTLQWRGRTI
ncbi:MAG: glycosyltransferase [Actinobacteria bacterium]|nr:glycosyltransferase [Actinomycetota bacterium]